MNHFPLPHHPIPADVMNRIIYVLTVVTTLTTPILTFAGLYGMNFK